MSSQRVIGQSTPAYHSFPRGSRAITNEVSSQIRGVLDNDRLYLLPLRAFIGISWLQSFAGKAVDPGWRDGTSISGFLHYQVESGQVAFPAYQALITEVFLPHAAILGWIVMCGELLAGLGILFGGFTSAALIGATFMNINFLLAGVPIPSMFFIAIQALLLLMSAGTVMGADAWLGHRRHVPRELTAWLVMLLALVVTGYAAIHVTAWQPKDGVYDPAMVLTAVGSLGAGWAAVTLLRARFDRHAVGS